MDVLFCLLLTYGMEELLQQQWFIFHDLKLLRKKIFPSTEISTPSFHFKISGNPAQLEN